MRLSAHEFVFKLLYSWDVLPALAFERRSPSNYTFISTAGDHEVPFLAEIYAGSLVFVALQSVKNFSIKQVKNFNSVVIACWYQVIACRVECYSVNDVPMCILTLYGFLTPNVLKLNFPVTWTWSNAIPIWMYFYVTNTANVVIKSL